jgi:MFS family permease
VVESKEDAVTETALRRRRIDQQHPRYKWVALSNTTLGALLASINASIVLISLPAIFRGIGLNPLAPGNISYLLWMLMGYLVVTAVLVLPLGRLGDIFGRVRIYNLGFAIFTVAAIALSFDPFRLGGGAVWLICWRVIQGIGGAMLMACSAAILTDAFPGRQRGMALGVNQVAAIAGQFLGLLIGGLLSEWDWRAVFWVGVPLGVGGTVWSFRSLRESRRPDPRSPRLARHSAFRRGPDRAVGSNHLRDPALRRSSDRLDQPLGARFDRAGRRRTGHVVLCRIARIRPHAGHQAVPVQALRAGQPCRTDGLRRAWRPAVHADHLAAGYLATTARLQL